MKILTIVGARPQFIKAAAVSHAFSLDKNIDESILHTGQHFDENMSEVFFTQLGIPKPRYNLGIGGGLHGEMTGAQLAGIEKILLNDTPDLVMVYGDTNSTLAGALAASKLNIRIAHVEAGLRSFNRRMPEEINRVLTDHISNVLFAPTKVAMQHLANEGILSTICHQVGDVMFDAALLFGERAKLTSSILNTTGVTANNFILTTIHRAENTDNSERLSIILRALREASKSLPIVWPVHPRTRKLLEQPNLRVLLGDAITLIDPVGYLDMLMLTQSATVIATDSGGLQKEAFFFQKPCVTLRDETEWVELVDSGWNTLASPNNISKVADTILNAINTKGKTNTPYGNGDAGKKITEILYQSTVQA